MLWRVIIFEWLLGGHWWASEFKVFVRDRKADNIRQQRMKFMLKRIYRRIRRSFFGKNSNSDRVIYCKLGLWFVFSVLISFLFALLRWIIIFIAGGPWVDFSDWQLELLGTSFILGATLTYSLLNIWLDRYKNRYVTKRIAFYAFLYTLSLLLLFSVVMALNEKSLLEYNVVLGNQGLLIVGVLYCLLSIAGNLMALRELEMTNYEKP